MFTSGNQLISVIVINLNEEPGVTSPSWIYKYVMIILLISDAVTGMIAVHAD